MRRTAIRRTATTRTAPRFATQERDPRPECGPFVDDATVKRNKAKAKATNYFSRYTTKLEDVLTMHMSGTLPVEMFPWVKAPKRLLGVSPGGGGGGGGSGGAGAGAGAGAGGGGSSIIDALTGHGDVSNPYRQRALEGGDTRAAVAGKRKKATKFSGPDGNGGGAAGGAGGGGGEEKDLYDRLLEAPRPRTYDGGRVIVFVLGGVSQMELAAVERLSRLTNREIVIGGTSFLTGKEMLRHTAVPAACKGFTAISQIAPSPLARPRLQVAGRCATN